MGARPQEQLAMSFLDVVMKMWAHHPGVYAVEEEEDDLVPALAQICIKALAADLREGSEGSRKTRRVRGEIRKRNGRVQQDPTLNTVANKIVHGVPDRIEVVAGDVRLFYVNHPNASEDWSEMWISGQAAIDALSRNYKHQHKAPSREASIATLLAQLGPSRVLPRQLPAP